MRDEAKYVVREITLSGGNKTTKDTVFDTQAEAAAFSNASTADHIHVYQQGANLPWLSNLEIAPGTPFPIKIGA